MQSMIEREWLDQYKKEYAELLADPEFATWLDRDYVLIAGGWQY